MIRLSNPELNESLSMLAKAMEDAQDDWWIIGSVAVALHGGDPGPIADIDVMTSRHDLDALYTRLPLTNTPEEGKPMFLSDKFGRWSAPPMDVEFMTGLKVRTGDDWQAVEPQTRQPISFADVALFVPEKAELIAILHLFGREEDLRRAATLAQ